MTGLLLSVLEVHLTGGKSTLLELATPAAIVIAAIVGAYFAAQYVGKNVAKELAAADLRLKRELRHDQRLREKEAARQTLDEVTNVATDAMDGLVDYAAKIKTAEDVARMVEGASDESAEKVELEETLDHLVSEVDRNSDASHAATRKHRPAHVRLQLRFPADHQVTERVAALMQAIKDSEVHERGMEPSLETMRNLKKPKKFEARFLVS